MFFSAQTRNATTRGTFTRGAVSCPKCRAEIPFFRVEAVADDFSLRCSKCGHRGHFRKAEITVQQFPDRRRKPR